MHDDDRAAKQDAAWRVAGAFLDSAYAEAALDSRYDRGFAVAVAVCRFIVREQIDPMSYLEWLRKTVKRSLVEVASPEEAAIIEAEEERRRTTCH